MKRKHAHLTFAVSALLLASLTAYQGVRLYQAHQVNNAIATARSAQLESSILEARFAGIAALANAGKYEDAAARYKEFVEGSRADLRHAALYNLGNLHLREALKYGAGSATQWLPLIELAKQSYRNLLREDPSDWNARYNLERALRLAPEVEEVAMTEEGPPPDSERTTSTISSARMDLP